MLVISIIQYTLVVGGILVGEGEHAGNISIVATDCGAGGGRLLTAIILLMVVSTKLLTVVTPTHKGPLASLVTIIQSPVQRSITVTLPLVTRILRCTASPTR